MKLNLSLRESYLFIRTVAVMFYWTGANEDICPGWRKEKLSKSRFTTSNNMQTKHLLKADN